MGYTTEFRGRFEFNTVISDELIAYLNKFNETRHMKRDVNKLKELYPDWAENCFNGELGTDGEYFVGGESYGFDFEDDSVINANLPAATQPGLWCQWRVSDDHMAIEWDGGEKFYHYIEWIEYLIRNFIAPSGYDIDGVVEWRGEEWDDIGKININHNNILIEC